MGKFSNLKTSPPGLWGEGSFYLQVHNYSVFQLCEQNGYPKIFIGRFWEKSGMGGGLVAIKFFGQLKTELDLFIFVRMSPLPSF